MDYNKFIRLISGQQVIVKEVVPKPSLAIGNAENLRPMFIQDNRPQAGPPPEPGPDYRRFRRERTLYYSPAPVTDAEFPRTFYLGESLWFV